MNLKIGRLDIGSLAYGCAGDTFLHVYGCIKVRFLSFSVVCPCWGECVCCFFGLTWQLVGQSAQPTMSADLLLPI